MPTHNENLHTIFSSLPEHLARRVEPFSSVETQDKRLLTLIKLLVAEVRTNAAQRRPHAPDLPVVSDAPPRATAPGSQVVSQEAKLKEWSGIHSKQEETTRRLVQHLRDAIQSTQRRPEDASGVISPPTTPYYLSSPLTQQSAARGTMQAISTCRPRDACSGLNRLTNRLTRLVPGHAHSQTSGAPG